jgi:diguanylate cyclase (GGDEF)-like protein
VKTKRRRNEVKQNSAFFFAEQPETFEGAEATADSLHPLQALNQVPAHIWCTDGDFRLAWGTVPFSAQTNEPSSAIRDVSPDGPKDFTDRERHAQMHRRALTGATVSYEIRESEKLFSAWVGPLRAVDGTIVGCVGAAVDITHQQEVMQRLWELASTDSVTGLANSRRLFDCLNVEIKRTDRTGRSFSVIMLDVDGLKTINDTHGHLCGSRALCRVADAVRSLCRATDLAARYGGDEFCLVLPETSLDGAKRMAERIAERLGRDTEMPKVSVSAGAAEFPLHGKTAEELIEAADRELYVAKAGRGRR